MGENGWNKTFALGQIYPSTSKHGPGLGPRIVSLLIVSDDDPRNKSAVLFELDLQAIAELSVHLLYFFFRKFVLSLGVPLFVQFD